MISFLRFNNRRKQNIVIINTSHYDQKMNKTYQRLIFILFSPTVCFALNIGVLEYSKTKSEPKINEITPSVRAIFYTKENKWVTGDQTKGITKWKVFYDGKIVGNITSDDHKTPKYMSDKGLQTITSEKKDIPVIGSITDEFGTWADTKTYRPLTLTTGEFFNDPEQWKLSKLSVKNEKAVKKEFHAKFDEVINCKDDIENRGKPWIYKDKDIKVIKSYSSKANWIIASLQLGPYKCDGPPEAAYAKTWFLISPQGKISYLDSGMTLIDAGDYDGDGRSEVIFQVSRYNQGGYILYFDDFKQNVDFLFGYH